MRRLFPCATACAMLMMIAACGAGASTGARDPGGSQPEPTVARAKAAEPENPTSDTEAWTDPASGLEWRIAPAGKTMEWEAAGSYCAAQGEGWRLPSVDELRSLIVGCSKTRTGGGCAVTDRCLFWSKCRNDDCGGCDQRREPHAVCTWPSALRGECIWYWSSSLDEDRPLSAWYVFFYDGSVNVNGVFGSMHVRCVRQPERMVR